MKRYYLLTGANGHRGHTIAAKLREAGEEDVYKRQAISGAAKKSNIYIVVLHIRLNQNTAL